jgi:ADP-ribosylglycohydrolase
MKKIILSRETYCDKMYACWLGKNIGGTLGAPYEGGKNTLDLDFYRPIPDGSAPNDDLDLQLVWLKMLEEVDGQPELQDFAQYWKDYLTIYPWDEYGFCSKNLARGLMPPVSGCFENTYIDNMGSPIRSEIWACLYPANPQAAAAIAWKDSAMDHAGGEGTYGEMFWAAVESAAFVESDPMTLIRIGLSMIPLHSSISRVIRDALWCHSQGYSWLTARHKIEQYYFRSHACHAVPNHGFTILGWLYGKDFGDKLCKAVNCGYDTDCTGATLGSVLGLLGGIKGIPSKWIEPIGEKIILHKYTGKFNSPKNIRELSNRMMKLALGHERFSDTVGFGPKTKLPADLTSLLVRNSLARKVLKTDPLSAILVRKGLKIQMLYNGDPVLLPGIAKTVDVAVSKGEIPVGAQVRLNVPKGWIVREQNGSFELFAEKVADRNFVVAEVSLEGKKTAAEFMFFGPGEAKGWEVGTNVEKCPVCWGRIEHCLCEKKKKK